MDQITLKEIIEKHACWLRGKPGGARADLYDADLSYADLHGAYLREANLRGADLREANLSMMGLRGENLSGANLYKANLYDSDLRGANLYDATVSNVDLRGADLKGAKNVPYIPMACPDTGEFIAWKKACDKAGRHFLVKLLIPEDARRSSSTGRKCRADKAIVLSIEPIFIKKVPEVVYSMHDRSFTYEIGKTVIAPGFDTNRFNECAPGIHFFINKQEAINYPRC